MPVNLTVMEMLRITFVCWKSNKEFSPSTSASTSHSPSTLGDGTPPLMVNFFGSSPGSKVPTGGDPKFTINGGVLSPRVEGECEVEAEVDGVDDELILDLK
jgi:hypothetical protein